MILVDPKVVELQGYNDIPHLLIPVVTDPHKAAGALAWAVQEMLDRYHKMQSKGVRNITAYNARARRRRTGAPPHRGDHRRAVRPDARLQTRGGRQHHPSGAARPRGRHPRDHRHAAPDRQRDHRPDQGEFPVAHIVCGGFQHRQPHHSGRQRRGKALGQRRYVLLPHRQQLPHPRAGLLS